MHRAIDLSLNDTEGFPQVSFRFCVNSAVHIIDYFR